MTMTWLNNAHEHDRNLCTINTDSWPMRKHKVSCSKPTSNEVGYGHQTQPAVSDDTGAWSIQNYEDVVSDADRDMGWPISLTLQVVCAVKDGKLDRAGVHNMLLM